MQDQDNSYPVQASPDRKMKVWEKLAAASIVFFAGVCVFIVFQAIQEDTINNYQTIALFGVDARFGLYDRTHNQLSDTIMVASVNQTTGECKLISVYRDTYLNLGNDTYDKCVLAYSQGGPSQALHMLNINLDLHMSDYVAVGFTEIINTVNALDGIMIDVDESELPHLNIYQGTMAMAEEQNMDFTPVSETGCQKLDGLQTAAYLRIQYTDGGYFTKAEREREVWMAIFEAAGKTSPDTLNQIARSIFGTMDTSLDSSELTAFLSNMTQYKIVAHSGFPAESMRDTVILGEKLDCVIPLNLEQNVVWLHQFLFDRPLYVPSDEIKAFSQKIERDASPYINT